LYWAEFGSLGLPLSGDKLLCVFIICKQNENSGLIKLSIIHTVCSAPQTPAHELLSLWITGTISLCLSPARWHPSESPTRTSNFITQDLPMPFTTSQHPLLHIAYNIREGDVGRRAGSGNHTNDYQVIFSLANLSIFLFLLFLLIVFISKFVSYCRKTNFNVFALYFSSNSPHRLQTCAWSSRSVDGDDGRRAELAVEVVVQVDLDAVAVVYFGVLGGAFVL